MSRFNSLKLAQLKPLLAAIGSRTSGTKPQLIAQLEHHVQNPSLVLNMQGTTRILSVDMGIKNLAYTVCDVKKLAQGFEMKVKEWKRIAVVDNPRSGDGENVIGEPDDPFGPAALSKTAYNLVKNELWPHNPDTVLIERQRFRSGGGSAVQEWTLRVNMLESMIWAIARTLEALDSEKKRSVRPVNPKQVAKFWVGGDTPDAVGKAKIEKKQKIDLVRTWLSEGTNDDMSMSFSGDAARTKQLFLTAASGKRVPKTDFATDRISKLDDLADCLLQTAAWCKWEDNRSMLSVMMKEHREISDDEILQKVVGTGHG